MRMNLNIGRESNFLNVHGMNQSLSKNGTETKQSIQSEKKDSVLISSMGRKSSIIDSFMKQRQNIVEQREKLKSNTLEKGGTLDSIKDQLESFDEQIKNIDQEIAKNIAEQSKKQAEEAKKANYSKPKTEEEVENQRFINITSISSELKQAEIVSSVKRKVDSESRILKAQIKTGNGNVESKKVEVKELDKQSANLASQISKKLTDLMEDVKENNQPQNPALEDIDKNDNKIPEENGNKFEEEVEE